MRSAGHGGAATAASPPGQASSSAARYNRVLKLQNQAGNQAVSRLLRNRDGSISRTPLDPGAPPKRPKVTGKRVEEEQHIKSMALDRPPPTFAQIYMAVKDGQFKTIFDGDLKRMDLTELRTLNSVAERQTEFFSSLTRQQEADPSFVPPEGVPDMVFRNVVKDFREFREGRLAFALATSERRAKAPDLFDPWMQFIADQYGGREIGKALLNSAGAAKMVVDAQLTGKEFEFPDAGILRYGYLDVAGFRALQAEELPDVPADEAAAVLHTRIVKVMKAQRTIMPMQLAKALLESGSGDPADTANLVARIEALDDQFKGAMHLVHQGQVGMSMLGNKGRSGEIFSKKHSNPLENMIFAWLKTQSASPDSVCGAYAEFIAEAEGDTPLAHALKSAGKGAYEWAKDLVSD